MNSDKRILLAITGASGSTYAQRFIEVLLKSDISRLYVIASKSAELVVQHEIRPSADGIDLRALLKEKKINDEQTNKLRLFNVDDLFAPVASGSAAATHTVILPCSMGTLGRIASGISSNLIERSADVALKQRLPLVICPRETPFNMIHLQNMLTLSQAGAHIVPLMPAFYQKPESIADLVDFMVGRVLEVLQIEHSLYNPWNARMR